MNTMEFILGVVSSIVATIIVAIYLNYKGVISLTLEKYKHKRLFFDRLVETGITNFYFSRKDFTRYRHGDTLGAYLKNATRTIKIIGLWMAESIEMEGIIEELRRILENDDFLLLEIAIVDPNSKIIPPLSKFLDTDEKELKARIKGSLESLYDLKVQLREPLKQKFQIKVYDALPIASIIMLDDGEEHGRIQFDFKIYQAPRVNSFGFELRNTGSSFYKLCRERYNILLKNSREFSIKKPPNR